MKLKYNAQGQNRKRLVESISQITKTPAKYQGVPSCAYQVGDYHIDKNAVLTGPDSLDLEDELLTLYGFEAMEREYEEPDTYESGLGGMGAAPSIEEVSDEAKAWAESDSLSKQDEPDRLVIEMPLTGFTKESLLNLEKMVASKANLIKKAIGADVLPIERTETTLKFPWFILPEDPVKVDAYARFISALCVAAKKQKRVTAQEKEVENEKFAFRVFLIRLGFVGDDYKAARKILLSKLEGSSAFKSVKEADHA